MRPDGAAKIIALLVVFGMVAGFAATYLVQAGVPTWLVLIAVVLIVFVPIVSATRSGRDRENSGTRR